MILQWTDLGLEQKHSILKWWILQEEMKNSVIYSEKLRLNYELE